MVATSRCSETASMMFLCAEVKSVYMSVSLGQHCVEWAERYTVPGLLFVTDENFEMVCLNPLCAEGLADVQICPQLSNIMVHFT